MNVLLQRSHHSSTRPDGWSGAPGEAGWVGQLLDLIAVRLRSRGIEVTFVDGDLSSGDTDWTQLQRHPEYAKDYNAFVSCHYDADIYGSGGWFWDRAIDSVTATQDDRLGAIFERRYRALSGVPSWHPERKNSNTRSYYGFRLTSQKTPGYIVEHGVGWGADKNWLRENINVIADLHAETLAEFGNVATTSPILGYSRYFTAPAGTESWASLYRTLSPLAGVRAEIAFAQALKETNNFTFTGIAQAAWANPAGLGVTGSPDVGNRFASPEDGVRAHLGHLLWYVGPAHPVVGFCDRDLRHFGAHKNYPNDVTSLNGRWAVPGVGYGESIAVIAARITTEVPVTDDEFREKFGRLIGPALEAEIQQRKQEAIDGAVKAVASKLSA